MTRCKNYELFSFLFMDRLQFTTKTKLINKPCIIKDVVSIKAVRNKFILYTTCNFEKEYVDLDFS